MSSRLARIASSLGVEVSAAPGADVDPEIIDVEHDSRSVGSGSLFACIRGINEDGHRHAPAAVRAGAVALLVEEPVEVAVPQVRVSDVRRAVGPAAALVHGRPSEHLDLIGVTGTNGKTTTVRILTEILQLSGVVTGEIGTLTGALTTPEAPELQRTLAGLATRGHAAVAMEVSSHALDQARVDGCRFAVAAFTNLGRDHLDFHGTSEAYFAAKARLFTPELSERAVIDVSTPHGRLLADTCGMSVDRIGDDAVEMLDHGATASRFRWRGHVVELPLGGRFNVTNAVMAAEIAVAMGLEPAGPAGALAEVTQVPGRFESIDEGQDFSVIVDYAHTPDGLEAVLAAARAVTRGRLVVVFGAGGDRDRDKRPRMGAVARELADRVVVTSDNPRGEDPHAIIDSVVAGMDGPPDLVEPDRRQAIRHAIAGARGGDVVVIAGKGHETTQTIGSEVLDLDDRAVARAEVRRLGGVVA